MIGDIGPLMAKDTSQSNIHQSTSIIRLGSHIKHSDDSADEHEEERAVDSGGNSRVHGESDVVEEGAACVGVEDDAAEQSSDKGGEDDVPPGQADGEEGGADVVGGRGEGDAELEGEVVPGRPVALRGRSGFEVDVGPFSIIES